MTIYEINNPRDFYLTMKRDGTFDGNNDTAYDVPCFNPMGWGEPVYNPDGKAPVFNPEHYIHPLTGAYASGPSDFSS